MKQIKKEIYKCCLCGAVEKVEAIGLRRLLASYSEIVSFPRRSWHECYKDKTKEGFDNKIGVMKLIGFEMED